MDGKPRVITLAAAVPVPAAARVDGAVAELQVHPDGIITAEIRIPGPPVP